MTISLRGYIFFGSAVQILEDVKSRLLITTPEAKFEPSLDVREGSSTYPSDVENATTSAGTEGNLPPSKSFLDKLGIFGKHRSSVEVRSMSPSAAEREALLSVAPSHSHSKENPASNSRTLEMKMVPIPGGNNPNPNSNGLVKIASHEKMFSLNSSPLAHSSSLTHSHLQSVYDLSAADIVRHNAKWISETDNHNDDSDLNSNQKGNSHSNSNSTPPIRLNPQSLLTGFTPASPHSPTKQAPLGGPSLLSLSLSAERKKDEQNNHNKHNNNSSNIRKEKEPSKDVVEQNHVVFSAPFNEQTDGAPSRRGSWFIDSIPPSGHDTEVELTQVDSDRDRDGDRPQLYQNAAGKGSSSLLAAVWESQSQRRDKDKEMMQHLLARQEASGSSYGSSNSSSPLTNKKTIGIRSSSREKSRSFSSADPIHGQVLPPTSQSSSNFNVGDNDVRNDKTRRKSTGLRTII